MSEINNNSIDLIIADPPWGVGVEYGTLVDNAPQKQYSQMMTNVIIEIGRILKKNGIAIFILPKTVRKRNSIYNYDKEFTKLFQKLEFKKIQTFDFLVQEDDFTCLPAKEIIGQGEDCHSEEIYGLVFAQFNLKTKIFPKNKTYKYTSKEGHPCPYPKELITDMLDTFFFNGTVLDSFMGTGSLGLEVLKRNGEFIGYELNHDYYEIAKTKLELFYKSL